MKILIFNYKLEMGGTQVNAIELSAFIRDVYGHDVVLFARPGPLAKLAAEKGLRFLPAHVSDQGVSFRIIRSLYDAVEQERPDVIHTWEFSQFFNAYYAAYLTKGVPIVATDMMSDGLTTLMPRSFKTTFGTPEFVDRARRAGSEKAELLLPPVDLQANAPGAVDSHSFRHAYNIDAEDLLVVTVSRLANHLKFNSLRRAINAIRILGHELPLRLAIVGDGPVRAELQHLAAEANSNLGRDAVVFTGELIDPRPAYSSADIVLGMGGSALRGMAFRKPVIVVGEQGFALPLTRETSEWFYYHGIYGVGDGGPNNCQLIEHIRSIAKNREMSDRMGEFSREFVVKHFALEVVAAQLERYFREAIVSRRRPLFEARDALRTAAIFGGRSLRNRVRRLVC